MLSEKKSPLVDSFPGPTKGKGVVAPKKGKGVVRPKKGKGVVGPQKGKGVVGTPPFAPPERTEKARVREGGRLPVGVETGGEAEDSCGCKRGGFKKGT